MGGYSPLLVDVDGEFGVKVVLPGRPNPASNREKRAQLGSGVVRKRKTCSGRWDVHAVGGKFGVTLLGVQTVAVRGIVKRPAASQHLTASKL